MVYVLTGIIICTYIIWLALEIKNTPNDPNEKRNEKKKMKILHIDLDRPEEKKPVKSTKPRKAYARNPK